MSEWYETRYGRQPVTSRADAIKAKAKHYFTGIPCKHGHVTHRLVSSGNCSECNRLGSKETQRKIRAGEPRITWDDRRAALKVAKSLPSVVEHKRLIARSARKRYRQKHPTTVNRAGNAVRRARKKGVGGAFKRQDIDRLLAEQNGRCAICSCDLGSVKWHVDHKIAMSRGGSNEPTNIQILCVDCNQAKRDVPDAEYRAIRASVPSGPTA